MIEYTRALLQQYRTRGVLLDTNILLLYLIGLYKPQEVARFKRTADRGFIEEDFYTLDAVLSRARCIVTTPHILTEVSNLAGQLAAHLRSDCFVTFARLVALLDERSVVGNQVAATPEFVKFGFTDAAILEISRGNHLVLTDDGPLYHYLSGQGVEALNFNHIRTLGWR